MTSHPYIAHCLTYIGGVISTIFGNNIKNLIRRKNAIQIELSEEWIAQEFLVIKNISLFTIRITSIVQCGFFSHFKPALEAFDAIHSTKEFTNYVTWKPPTTKLIENKLINPSAEKKVVFRVTKKVKIKIVWENIENGKKYSRKYVLFGLRYRKPL